MNLQPTLSDELVHLRPLTEDDFEALYAAANDPKIWEQHPNKRNERDEFEQFFAESIQSKGALAILDATSGALIGSSRYKPTVGFENGVEIGWTFLTRDYWGGRYNKSVKALMLQHAFEYVDHVFLYIAIDNIRSQMAAKKIGGQLIKAEDLPGLFDKGPEHLIYMLKNETL